MNANERIIFRLGQSIVELEMAQDKIRELEDKVKELEGQKDRPDVTATD